MITGFILAGGKSQRMGKDKGLLPLGGIPMVAHIIHAMRQVVDEVVLITQQPDYLQFGLNCWADILPENGPIGGIYTALKRSPTAKNLFLACDTPFIHTDAIRYLLARSSPNTAITIAATNGQLQPLFGIYDRDCADTIGVLIRQGERRLQHLLSCFTCSVVEMADWLPHSPHLFDNINTPPLLEKAQLHIMKIHILAFGKIADVLQTPTLERTGLSSVAMLRAALAREFPALATLHYQVAINKKIVGEETILTEGCEVALLPPFSGG